MTTDQEETFLGAQPFRTFVMHLADGRAIEVVHREFAALAPSGRTIVVFQRTNR